MSKTPNSLDLLNLLDLLAGLSHAVAGRLAGHCHDAATTSQGGPRAEGAEKTTQSQLQKAGKRRRPLWRQPFFFVGFHHFFHHFLVCHARQFGCQILLSVKMSWLSIVYIYSRRGGRKPMLCMWRQLISLTWMFIGCNVPDEQPKVRVPSQSQCHCPQPSPPTWKVSADEVKADGRAVLIFLLAPAAVNPSGSGGLCKLRSLWWVWLVDFLRCLTISPLKALVLGVLGHPSIIFNLSPGLGLRVGPANFHQTRGCPWPGRCGGHLGRPGDQNHRTTGPTALV